MENNIKNEYNVGPCKGILGFLFGHKFDGRWDSVETGDVPPATLINEAIHNHSAPFAQETIEAIGSCYRRGSDTYVCDICPRCGMVIKVRE